MVSPLDRIPIRTPGNLGLVTDQAGVAEQPQWSLTLRNAVINNSNRIASRNGWSLVTTTGGHSDDTEAIFEYVESATSTRIISVANSTLYEGTSTLTNVTGTATVGGDDWQFVNYNGKVVGVRQGDQPIIKTGAGNFADVVASAGTAPTGNAAVATHGRIYAFDSDMQTIQFCVLLDETDWGGAGSGSLDMANVWPVGLDVGVAIVEWNNFLVVFGERSIVIFTGLDDPGTNLALAGTDDMVTGDGLVSRDSVVSTGTDLIYLSRTGLRSLRRGIAFDKLPLTTIAPHLQLKLSSDIDTALSAATPIRMEYHRKLGAIIARIGSAYWYFDIRTAGAVRASQWDSIDWVCARSVGSTLYLGQNGGVAEYTGYDDNGSAYNFEWLSPWFRVTSRRFIPKSALVYVAAGTTYSLTMSWAWDYDASPRYETRSLMVNAVSEYNVAEWGIGEWGPANQLVAQQFDLGGDGDQIQIGLSTSINGGQLEIQEADLIGKLGRLHR